MKNLTEQQKIMIAELEKVQAIEESNNFSNGDLWNNLEDMISRIRLHKDIDTIEGGMTFESQS